MRMAGTPQVSPTTAVEERIAAWSWVSSILSQRRAHGLGEYFFTDEANPPTLPMRFYRAVNP